MKINIEGMMCQNCAKHVTEALQNLGLSEIKIDLAAKCAYAAGSVDEATIKAAIEEEGYNFISLEA